MTPFGTVSAAATRLAEAHVTLVNIIVQWPFVLAYRLGWR